MYKLSVTVSGSPVWESDKANLTMQVSIKQIHYIYPSTDIERSEQEVSVTSGKATVVEFNQGPIV